MSLLDDENILTTDLKKKIINPFFLLKHIFILARKDNNGELFRYKDDIFNALKSIKIPKHTKWYINYNTIVLADESYWGIPADYDKIIAHICFFHRTERLMCDIEIGRGGFSEIINEFTKLKYNLTQITNYKFIYE